MSLITKAGNSTRARKRAGTTKKNPVRMPRGIATHAPKATSEACAASSVKGTTSVQSPGTVARASAAAGAPPMRVPTATAPMIEESCRVTIVARGSAGVGPTMIDWGW